MDPNNWDLQAVVRGCCFTGTTAAATVDPFSSFPSPFLLKEQELEALLMNIPELSATRTSLYELEDLCKPFILTPIRQTPPPPHQPQQRPQSQITRPKRRKNQHKKVTCQVPADGDSSDIWAWRKYGQKPIKGSPYPRGYYKCSSSKGCFARKQVERSLTDPSMLVITYTAEHSHPVPTHRNSLAGSTRHKLPPPSSSAAAAGGGDGYGTASMEDEDDELLSIRELGDMEMMGVESMFSMPELDDVSGRQPLRQPRCP